MVDILAFGAHPDDIEFYCGGILARLASEGRSIVMVDLSLGDKSSSGTPEIRKLEALASAALINAKRHFLNFLDCEIVDSYESRLELVKVIRLYRPRLVLAPFWKGEGTHPDHVACGVLARHACRYARFGTILPELPAHKPEGILHYTGLNQEPVDFIVDVTDYVDIWKAMMRCHSSQMKTFPYDEWNLRIASRMGVYIEKAFAQGLIKGNPLEIDDLMAIAKGVREL